MVRIINARGVNEAYWLGMDLIRRAGVTGESRAGPVLAIPEPVLTEYSHPRERVLLDPARDANPFFHLFEALHMLAGRDDAAFLNRYVRDFGDRFAETDGRVHGAYGYRWRNHFAVAAPPDWAFTNLDQLSICIDKLQQDPNDRQAVIQMWDAGAEFPDSANDLMGKWRDRPCNTHIYLRIVEGQLDLTVCCRSNDMIWGAYGANAVHFSILQEYLAGRIGVPVGRMYQLSNNMHVYTEALDKITARASTSGRYKGIDGNLYDEPFQSPYARFSPLPIGTDWIAWDRDLHEFMSQVEAGSYSHVFRNSWFSTTAVTMSLTHDMYREFGAKSALPVAEQISAPDWRAAVVAWLQRRVK
jgi:hypothetical protein